MNDVSWDDLRMLLAIAREGSIRSAAEKLAVSPSTMSRRIASLEQQIGGALIVRTGGGVELTTMGVLAHDIAANMEQRFVKMARIAETAQSEPTSVHFAVSEGIGTFWILPRLREFQDTHPSTILRMTCGISSTDVMRLEADLAIEYAQPAHPELICVKLATVHFCFYASPAYLQRAGTPRCVADLAQHALIEQASNQARSGFMKDELKALGLTDRITFVANTSSAHFNALECGLGIGILPTYATPLGTDLKALDLDYHFAYPVWLTYHPDHRDNSKVMAFVAWLRRLFDPVQNPCFGDAYITPKDLRRLPGNAPAAPINFVTHGGRFVPTET